MNFNPRKVAASVLLLAALSVASVNVHAAAHLSRDAFDRGWCTTCLDPPANVDAGAADHDPFVQTVVSFDKPPIATENEFVRRLFARGPPQDN